MTRRPWLPEENRIASRYVRALASGRYRFRHEAVTACLRDLGRLYKRLLVSNPNHPVAAPGRSRHLVGEHLSSLLGRQGLIWTSAGLTGPERAATVRYASALVSGRFPDALRAAEACLAEVRALPPASRPLRPRTLATIHLHVLDEAHHLRRTWPRAHWRAEEDRVLHRYGRALARGEYADSKGAVRDCSLALAKLPRPRVGGYVTRAVRTRLLRWAHEAGWTSFLEPWSPVAQRVIKKYLRRLYTGEFRSVPAAAAECTRELRRLPVTMKTGRPAETDAVLRELTKQAQRMRLPRHRTDWHPGELRILEAYARRVGRGDFSGWHEAAVACRKELQGFWTRATRRSPVAVRRPAGRGVPGIHGKMLRLAHELHLPGPERRAWTEREDQAVASWVRWYDRYRTPRKRGPLGVAASGLQEELENKGFARTVSACRERLRNGWLQMHGLA